MVNDPHDHRDPNGQSDVVDEVLTEELDTANQSLADALRKSFKVLKVLMFVLVIFYVFSGVFGIEQGSRGIITRIGRIHGVGAGGDHHRAILEPDWYFSCPWPIDKIEMVSVAERQIELEFMLKLNDEERKTGKVQRKFKPLSPERDDYLITGDKNILHATRLVIRYTISDVVNYLTNVYDAPEPTAEEGKGRDFLHYPEYTLMRNLARNAVIEAAAEQRALDIRGDLQDEFLLSVGQKLAGKLKELEDRGAPLGISIDPGRAVLAPKGTGDLEGITPPLQTKEKFEEVYSAQSRKAQLITAAKSEAESRLVQVAGPQHQLLAEAIDKELELMRQIAEAENGESQATVADLREALVEQTQSVETLLRDKERTTGEVRTILAEAEKTWEQIRQDASGDYEQLMAQLPQYLRNPDIFTARRRDEMRKRALSNPEILKMVVDPKDKEIRITVENQGGAASEAKEKEERVIKRSSTPSDGTAPKIKMN